MAAAAEPKRCEISDIIFCLEVLDGLVTEDSIVAVHLIGNCQVCLRKLSNLSSRLIVQELQTRQSTAWHPLGRKMCIDGVFVHQMRWVVVKTESYSQKL